MGLSFSIFVIVILFILGSVGYVIMIYNSLVQVRNNVEKAWNNIDVLLQQRHDELIKLVDVVKAYAKHETSLLEGITKLREGFKNAGSIDEKTAIENSLNKQMGSLRIALENYPDLKASQNFLALQDRVSGIESAIADRREFFNESVNIYNIQIERFPDMLLASLMKLNKKNYLEVDIELKNDVKMDII